MKAVVLMATRCTRSKVPGGGSGGNKRKGGDEERRALLDVRLRFLVGTGRPSVFMLIGSAGAFATMSATCSLEGRKLRCPQQQGACLCVPVRVHVLISLSLRGCSCVFLLALKRERDQRMHPRARAHTHTHTHTHALPSSNSSLSPAYARTCMRPSKPGNDDSNAFLDSCLRVCVCVCMVCMVSSGRYTWHDTECTGPARQR